jgi:hypothetical protein
MSHKPVTISLSTTNWLDVDKCSLDVFSSLDSSPYIVGMCGTTLRSMAYKSTDYEKEGLDFSVTPVYFINFKNKDQNTPHPDTENLFVYDILILESCDNNVGSFTVLSDGGRCQNIVSVIANFLLRHFGKTPEDYLTTVFWEGYSQNEINSLSPAQLSELKREHIESNPVRNYKVHLHVGCKENTDIETCEVDDFRI